MTSPALSSDSNGASNGAPNDIVSGVVLLGHGSREPGTVSEIRDLGRRMAEALPDTRFEHAFLNQEPSLAAAVETLVRAGCDAIRVIPLLVFVGKHLLEDVPSEIARLQALYPRVRLERTPHLFGLPGFPELLTACLNPVNPVNPARPETRDFKE